MGKTYTNNAIQIMYIFYIIDVVVNAYKNMNDYIKIWVMNRLWVFIIYNR